ncbi:MAG: LemA family protein [Gammaproteobacteria bacterium]|nr:LemA family protein [Gammaproteobacteria bacterium]
MDYALTAIAAGALLWAVVIYNRLVRDRNRVAAGWSDIDVQLKRRHDLIPKLVAAVQQYASYESSTIAAITELRKEAGAREGVERARMEGDISRGLQRLIALAEAYPELQASENFLSLQRDISAVENDIQYSRRYYNGAVRNLNTRIESFPDLVLARLFAFRPRDYFELETPS